MAKKESLFWKDLEKDLTKPRYRKTFLLESIRIHTIDEIINTLDKARLKENLTKNQLATSIGVEPANIRRLFTRRNPNPTIGTISDIAASLGMRIVLEELPKRGKSNLMENLKPQRR